MCLDFRKILSLGSTLSVFTLPRINLSMQSIVVLNAKGHTKGGKFAIRILNKKISEHAIM